MQYSYEDRPRPPYEDGGWLPEIRVNNVEGSNRLSFGGDGTIFKNRLEESKLQIVDNFTWRTGDHTLKLGTNNILANTMNMFWLAGNGLYTFNSLALFQQKSPSRHQRTLRACPVSLTANQAGEMVVCPQPDIPIAEFGTLEWSVYGQDEFQATDRLTITAGVRLSGLEFQTIRSGFPRSKRRSRCRARAPRSRRASCRATSASRHASPSRTI